MILLFFFHLVFFLTSEARWDNLKTCDVERIRPVSERCQCYTEDHMHCSYRDVEDCNKDNTLDLFQEIRKISVYGKICNAFVLKLHHVIYDMVQLETEPCPDTIDLCRFVTFF